MNLKLKSQLHTLIPLCLLILSALACTLPIGSEEATEEPIPVPTEVFTEEALGTFEAKLFNLIENTEPGDFSLTITEEELAAVVCQQLEGAKAEGAEIPISEMGVALGDDLIHIYGKLDIPALDATGLVSIYPSVTPDGLVGLEVTEVDFGFIEFEPSVLAEISSSLEDAINQYLLSAQNDVILTDITITETDLTLEGVIQG